MANTDNNIKKPYDGGYHPIKDIGGELVEDAFVTSYSGPDTIRSIFSPTLFPPLKITTNKIEREIEVVFVSTENEDKQLLHKLLTKTRAERL